jgi:periodic tryptophan protein 2
MGTRGENGVCVVLSGLEGVGSSVNRGTLVYSNDDPVVFDPFDLDIELTPRAVLTVLGRKEYLKALVMAFRLSEPSLIAKTFEAVPPEEVRLVARQVPVLYLEQLLKFVAEHAEKSPHMEYDLMWIYALLSGHGRWLRDRSGQMASVLRSLQKGLLDYQEGVSTM